MKNSIRFGLLLISLVVSGTVCIWACAGGDWDDGENSMFTPELIHNASYEPFFRTAYSPFYGNDKYLNNQNTSCNEINIQEWDTYFQGKISSDALHFWLYRSALSEIDSVLVSFKKKNPVLNDTLTKYRLTGSVPTEQIKSFLFYLGYARRNEAFSLNDLDNWSGEIQVKKQDGDWLQKQITGGLKLLSFSTNAFIRERYYFQLIRLYYFNKQYAEAIAFYQSNLVHFKSGNSMKWRAMGYAAASYYKLGKFAEANYLYSLLYEGFDPQKKSAFLSFHVQEDADWNACLQLAQTTKEKSVLWLLFGIAFDETKAMTEIYQLNPAAEELELLLVRAVNKEEEKFTLPLMPAYPYRQTGESVLKTDEKLRRIIGKIASEKKSLHPDLWNMAAAYLHYASKEYAAGDTFLNQIPDQDQKPYMYNAQYQLIRLFGKLSRQEHLQESIEENILPELKVLFSNETSTAPFRYMFAQQWTRHTLAVLYARQHEFEKAEMIQPGTLQNYFSNVGAIKKMIRYMESDRHSLLEKFFLSIAPISKDDYLDLLGIRYAQKDMLDSALLILKQSKSVPKELYGDPFLIHINDCHDCDHAAPQAVKYTSQSYLEKMIRLKKQAGEKKENADQNYFLLANAFYNMSYFGNARYFYDNKIMPFYTSYYFPADSNHLGEMDNSVALKYYELALANATNKEFKAQCAFMAAKCEQNRWYLHKPKAYPGDFQSGTYFALLKKNYANTQYYAEIINECAYFHQYVTGSK